MKFLQFGLGNQGLKRIKTLKRHTVFTVDPYVKNSNFKKKEDIDFITLSKIDAAIISTPEEEKFDLIKFCFNNNINVLVEKPLLLKNLKEYNEIEKIGLKKNLICYTAYNHRFEPHIINCKKIISDGKLGKIYSCRIFYGNGTARIVKNSKWKDKGLGVIPDLGSHLLDILSFILDKKFENLKLIASNKFENHSTDHAILSSNDKEEIHIELEMTLCMWKNTFTCDIIGEKGSIHIDCLCKWGPSHLTYRKRIFPSGLPIEKKKTIISNDPTWQKEINYFMGKIRNKEKINLEIDKYIFNNLKNVI